MTTAQPTIDAPAAPQLRRWTVEEYHRMIQAGILTTDDQVELLDGEIVYVPPQDPPHSGTTQRSDGYLKQRFANRAHVRVQLPITLATSEPEPDLAVVRPDRRDYYDQHPHPEDIFLIVEIANTTLNTDLTNKAQIYGKANIQEYWVIDVVGQKIYVMREPYEAGYHSQVVLSAGDRILPLAFPELEIVVDSLIGLKA
jgi:Uma2 family endonuclease